jgi:hypothetical protein
MSHWEFQSCGAISFGGRIADVEELTELPDEEAIAKAHTLFSERPPLRRLRVVGGRARAYRASSAPPRSARTFARSRRQDERRNSRQSQRKACEIRVREIPTTPDVASDAFVNFTQLKHRFRRSVTVLKPIDWLSRPRHSIRSTCADVARPGRAARRTAADTRGNR